MYEGTVQSKACAFCGNDLTPDELDNPDSLYREVLSWVTGPKLQSPVLREQSGRVAHVDCINKALNGQAPDQESIPGLEGI